MSLGSISPTPPGVKPSRSWQLRWELAPPATRTGIQLAIFLVAVLVAFHYSLVTLLQSLDANSPLAYVGLVPAIALALAALRPHGTRVEPAIHDRQLDTIIGITLISAAVILEVIVPKHLTTMFWVWRIDLLGLPLFVAGAVALIFGTRVLWRQKFAVGYLFLAWPLPYTDLLARFLGGFTKVTLAALRHIVGVLHIARVMGGSGGSVFDVVHHGHPFQLSVVSACTGVDGLVGFTLIGLAFGALVRGPRLRRALWLAGGMVLLWVINLGRLTIVFWAGSQWGEHLAINVLHPFIGLVTFNTGVVLMVLALKPMGLQIVRPPTPRPTQLVPKLRPRLVIAVPRVFTAATALAVASLFIGVSNSHLRQYDPVANADGEPRLASYSLNPASPKGWKSSLETVYTWAKPFFGSSSTWYRFVYEPLRGAASDLHSSVPVVADVVNSADVSSFSAYGVQACYQFHGYTLRSAETASLGDGINAQTLSYQTKSAKMGDWSIIWWVWPVKSGNSTRYERVILYIQDTAGTVVSTPAVGTLSPAPSMVTRALTGGERLAAERTFLIRFAREVVQNQTKVLPGTQAPGLRRAILAAEFVPRSSRSPAGEAVAQLLANDMAKLNRLRIASYTRNHGHPPSGVTT